MWAVYTKDEHGEPNVYTVGTSYVWCNDIAAELERLGVKAYVTECKGVVI